MPAGFEDGVAAVVVWFPGDLLSCGDRASSWDVYDSEQWWQSGFHPGGERSLVPGDVPDLPALTAAVTALLDASVELHACAAGICPAGALTTTWYPAFVVRAKPA